MNELGHSEIQGLFSAYLEQDLPATQRAEFLAHLEGCQDCHHGLEQFEQTMALVRGLPKNRAPVAFSRQVMRRVKHRNRRQQAFGMVAAGPLRVPVEAIIPVLLAAAVVAMLLIASH